MHISIYMYIYASDLNVYNKKCNFHCLGWLCHKTKKNSILKVIEILSFYYYCFF